MTQRTTKNPGDVAASTGASDSTNHQEGETMMTTVYRVTDWAGEMHFGTADQIIGRDGAKFARENNYWRAVAPNPNEADAVDLLDRYRDVTIHAQHDDYWIRKLTGWEWDVREGGSTVLYLSENETFGYVFDVILTEDGRIVSGMECPASWDFDNGSEISDMANAFTKLAEWLGWQGTALDAIKAVHHNDTPIKRPTDYCAEPPLDGIGGGL